MLEAAGRAMVEKVGRSKNTRLKSNFQTDPNKFKISHFSHMLASGGQLFGLAKALYLTTLLFTSLLIKWCNLQIFIALFIYYLIKLQTVNFCLSLDVTPDIKSYNLQD